MNYPKRLIEVDLPIKRISAHARREKSIRHGHISTLHIWWARRPLAACRAVICAALWPDPADDNLSPQYRLACVERLTRTDAMHIAYEITITDPQAYTQAWTNKRTFTLRPDWELMEYNCNENNRDLNDGHIK